MNEYDSIVKNMLVQQIKHECRLSDRQIALLKWIDIGDHKIRTRTGREVKISDSTYRALMAMPTKGKWVFTESALPPQNLPSASPIDRLSDKIGKARSRLHKMPKIRITIG